MRALAIVCARNESIHIRQSLADLLSQGLEIILIDHDSTDDTVTRAQCFLGRGLLSIEKMPWRGFFSLADQLEFKRQIIKQVPHDWVLHVDADERLDTPRELSGLMEALRTADTAGYNCLNFNEFVFIPRPGETFEIPYYRSLMTTYYFFRPCHPRLMRAWKRNAGFDNVVEAGHRLIGDGLKVFPQDLILRHYLMLSGAHWERKYKNRIFAEAEVAKGWHRDRISIPKVDLATLTTAAHGYLRDLPFAASRTFATDRPAMKHFWEW